MRVPAWRATIVALFASLACSSGGAVAGLEPQPQLARIELSATPPSISVGEATFLQARGLTASGGAATSSVEWTAAIGQLVVLSDSEARFSAASAGSFWIVAQALTEPFPVDSVLIVVTAPQSPLASIRVTPDSLDLFPGGENTFVATGTRQDGSTMIPAVAWSATGGTISGSGAFTAGSIAGTYVVRATAQGAGLSDSAVVVIRNSGTGGPGYPNEPPGLETPYTITAPQPNPFDVLPRVWNANDGKPLYSLDEYGWSIEAGGGEAGDLTRWTIVQDAERGNVLSYALRAGDPGGRAPGGTGVAGFGHTKLLSSGSGAPFVARQLFLGYWVKLSPNWTDPNVAMKHLYFMNSMTNSGDGNWYINLSSRSYPYLNGGYQIQHRGMPTYDWYGPGASASRGVWHKYEMYAKFNSAGLSDGVLKIWIDGVQVVNRKDVMLGNLGRDFDWAKFGVITGGGGNPVPADAWVRFDDWYMKVGP